MNIRLWDGDPLLGAMSVWVGAQKIGTLKPERFLAAGIGIEFSTRRRKSTLLYFQLAKQILYNISIKLILLIYVI